jgi:hypothetical protein
MYSLSVLAGPQLWAVTDCLIAVYAKAFWYCTNDVSQILKNWRSSDNWNWVQFLCLRSSSCNSQVIATVTMGPAQTDCLAQHLKSSLYPAQIQHCTLGVLKFQRATWCPPKRWNSNKATNCGSNLVSILLLYNAIIAKVSYKSKLAKKCSARDKIPGFLWNPKVH